MNETGQKISAPKAAPTPGDVYATWEAALAARVGLNQDNMRALRRSKLTQGLHWTMQKNRVCYSVAGVQEVQRIMKLSPPQKTPPVPPGKDTAQPDHSQEPVTLHVFRIFAANPHILEAHLPDQDPAIVKNRLRVRVKDNKNFVKAMPIPVRELAEGLYELARACPRSRGRW